ncbi:MAG: AEC family transporter, partial [Geminicoccaceae bacterium]
AVVPLFSLIVLGFLAGKRRWIEEPGVKALVGFIFNIAMPALLFRLVVVSDVTELINARFLLCHFSVQAAVAMLGVLLGRAFFQLAPQNLVIQGFGSSFPNTVLLGIPLMLALYGERGAVPVIMIFAFNVALYSIVTMLLEVAGRRAERVDPLALIKTTSRAIASNPIILAAVAGMIVGGSGFGLAPVLDRSLSFIGQAGPPIALFALGASLSVREMAKGLHGPLGAAGLMTSCKLLLHPALAWIMAVPVLGLDPFLAAAAVIVAALPVGANVYIFAQHYDVAVLEASSAVLISTGISMITIPVLLWFLV